MSNFGEVIESTPTYFKVHTWQWDTYPALGSLVVTSRDGVTLFGIIAHLETGSMDAGRQPFPYKKTESELKRDQPQIYTFLQTLCTCLVIGYQENGTFYYQLPPYPPKIHSFVRPVSRDEFRVFCSTVQFLQLILNNNSITSPDELLLALLKQLADQDLLSAGYLEEFVTTLSLITGNDYRKLKLFLMRAEPLLN